MTRSKRSPWIIPEGTPPSKCRGCQAEIYFVAYVRKADNYRGRAADAELLRPPWNSESRFVFLQNLRTVPLRR